MSNGENPLGRGEAIHTPTSSRDRAQVQASSCDKVVPPAAESIIGQCVYYYRPVHAEYVNKSGLTTLEAIKAWLTIWNPWDDQEAIRKLLENRDALILPSSDSPMWSRATNFMVRHIGCGHQLPKYYIGYGYYYCSNYGEKLEPRLSPQGRQWLAKARWQLQRNMERGLGQNMTTGTIMIPCKYNEKRGFSMEAPKLELELDSEKFKGFAFKTHVPSYLDAGLAQLPLDDLRKVGGQPNIEEWLDGDTWEQARDSGVDLAKEKIRHPVQTVKEAKEALVGVIRDLLE